MMMKECGQEIYRAPQSRYPARSAKPAYRSRPTSVYRAADSSGRYTSAEEPYPARRSWDGTQARWHEIDPAERAEGSTQAMRTLATLAVAVVVFLACTGIIYFKCMISAAQIEIGKLQAEIRKAESEYSRLEAIHTEAVDLNNIRLSAQQLGMGYPQSGQIRTIASTSVDASEGDSTSLQTN
jgi:cell division protein FtsL